MKKEYKEIVTSVVNYDWVSRRLNSPMGIIAWLEVYVPFGYVIDEDKVKGYLKEKTEDIILSSSIERIVDKYKDITLGKVVSEVAAGYFVDKFDELEENPKEFIDTLWYYILKVLKKFEHIEGESKINDEFIQDVGAAMKEAFKKIILNIYINIGNKLTRYSYLSNKKGRRKRGN